MQRYARAAACVAAILEENVQINEVMTPDVYITRPDQSIAEAARRMAEADVGCLPVGDEEKLIGMVTDRDIVLRAVARGLGGDTRVREVMTESIKYCYDDQEVGEVARNMAELGVRRLPVVNRDKRIVGVVALSNITHNADGQSRDALLRGVAVPH